LPSQGQGDGTSSKILLELMTGNVVISGVDAYTFVVLSKAESHVPCMELFGTTEYVTLLPRCRTSRGVYNEI